MHCQEIQELLSAYIDGMLEPSVQNTVERHLEHCPACRQEAQDLKIIVGLVQELPLLEPPAEFRQRLRARLEDDKGLNSAAGQGPARGWRYGLAAVAASFLLVLGVASAWHQFSYKTGAMHMQSTALMENQQKGAAPHVQKDMMDSRPGLALDGVTLSDESVAASHSLSTGSRPKSLVMESGSSPSAKQEIIIQDSPGKTTPDGNGVAARGAAAPSALQPVPIQKAVLDLRVEDKGNATREVFGIARRYGGVAAVLPDTGDKEILLRVPGSQFEKVISDVGRAGKIIREDYTGGGLAQLPPEVEQIELYGKGGSEQEKTMAPALSVKSVASLQASSRDQDPSRLDSNVPMATIRVRLE